MMMAGLNFQLMPGSDELKSKIVLMMMRKERLGAQHVSPTFVAVLAVFLSLFRLSPSLHHPNSSVQS